MPGEIALTVDTRELEAALLEMPRKLAGNVMRAALQAGGNVMLDALVAHTPERQDVETPESNALAPGILKADMHTQIQMGNATAPPRVKVGPSQIAGRVARWQNDGYNLTTHGRSRAGRHVIKAVPGRHFIEAAFDESAQTAVDMFLATLADGLFGVDNGSSMPEGEHSQEAD